MPEKISLFVPCSLCLFGEHSDWAGIHRAHFYWSLTLILSYPLTNDGIICQNNARI